MTYVKKKITAKVYQYANLTRNVLLRDAKEYLTKTAIYILELNDITKVRFLAKLIYKPNE